MSARTSTPPAPAASRTARRLLRGTTVGTSFSRGRAAGDRRVGRQSPPPARSKSLTPFTPCCAHCPTPAPAPMSRTFSPVISRGNANNPICYTPSASVVAQPDLGPRPNGWRRHKGGDHLRQNTGSVVDVDAGRFGSSAGDYSIAAYRSARSLQPEHAGRGMCAHWCRRLCV